MEDKKNEKGVVTSESHPLLTPYTAAADDKNDSFNPIPNTRIDCACVGLITFGVVSLLTESILMGLIYLSDDKREIHAPKFQVDSVILFPFTISSSSSSNSRLTANWNVDFTIRNEQEGNHQQSLFYLEDFEISVYFSNNYIPSTALIASKFFLQPNTNTVLHANLAASSVLLNQTLADAIINERAAYGALEFTFKMNASLVEYPNYDFKSQNGSDFLMRISCDQLNLVFVSNPVTATLFRGPVPCNSAIV